MRINSSHTQSTIIDKEISFNAIGVSPGIAIGHIYFHQADDIHFCSIKLPKSKISQEVKRFQETVSLVREDLTIIQQKANKLVGEGSGEEMGYLLEAYLQMLQGSRLIRGIERRIQEGLNAESAIRDETMQILAGFDSIDDSYLAARADDIRDIGRRLTRRLMKGDNKPFSQLQKNSIILAEELSPADTALLDPTKVIGFITATGSVASHTAIMARSLGIPAIVGISDKISEIHHEDFIILDGNKGIIFVNPTPIRLEKYRKKRADFLRARRQLHHFRKVPAITEDGTEIKIYANLDLPNEIDSVLQSGAVGVGLLRSEFLFMNRETLPSEDEQYVIFRDLIGKLAGRPLTIRTLDAGGDKLAPALGIPKSANPALGLRAIRLCLTRPDILKTQMSAILRAGALGPVRILIPMISGLDEIKQVKNIWETVIADLQKQRITIASPPPPLGIMIEIPSAALSADSLSKYCDFFAIGTNDLTQYSLAIDRTDDTVAHLYNSCHPAVLRLVQFTAEAALKANIPLSICGEMAGDPRLCPLLLGLGFRELSMAPSSIPLVKKKILTFQISKAISLAQNIMTQTNTESLNALLDNFSEI